ncbi:MAG: DUF1799 domain-containing protein [Rhodobacteraceae bacterium]|nr:DUF1799 domain-containing protein [Paracoccaceae bacterium]
MARLGRVDGREPVRIDAEIARQFQAMGVEVSVEETPQVETEGFEVMPENWEIVCAFLACETQWQAVAGFSGLSWLGLNYAGVDVVLRRLQFGDDVFAGLQEMETSALETFAEEKS